MDRLGMLAGNIMAKRYVAFVAPARIQDNIPAHILANLLQADYYPTAVGSSPNNASSIVFALDNHGIAGISQTIVSNNYTPGEHIANGCACLWKYTYDDVPQNTLATPEYYLDEIVVELDTRAKLIRYPWEL